MTPSTLLPFYAMNNAIIKHYMDLYISTVSRYLNLDQGDTTIENKKQIEKNKSCNVQIYEGFKYYK